MADAVNSVVQIGELVFKIKEAVEKARQNREDCREIGRRVDTLRPTLVKLRGTAAMRSEPAMSRALLELEQTLRRAYKLVAECQGRNVLWVFFTCTAGKLSKQLSEVNQCISWRCMDAMFLCLVSKIAPQGDGDHPPPPEPEDQFDGRPAESIDSRLSAKPKAPSMIQACALCIQHACALACCCCHCQFCGTSRQDDETMAHDDHPFSPPPDHLALPPLRPLQPVPGHHSALPSPPPQPVPSAPTKGDRNSQQIAEAAVKIKAAEEKVRHNKEECVEIGKRVNAVSAFLSRFEGMDMMEPAMCAVLEKLRESFLHASALLMDSQRKLSSKELGEALDQMVLAVDDMIDVFPPSALERSEVNGEKKDDGDQTARPSVDTTIVPRPE